VWVIIGAPMTVAGVAEGERVPRAAIKELTDRLHARLQELFDEAQRRVGA
jgi:hypothetical protein